MKKRTKGRVQAFQEKAGEGIERKKREPRTSEKAENRKPKQKKKAVNKGRLILMVIVVILFIGLCMSAKNIFDLWSEQKALEAKNQELLLEKESLKEELDNVNDAEYIEEQARVQLKLIKPGEILYILQNDENEGDQGETDDKKDN